jgi:hypothetical protein
MSHVTRELVSTVDAGANKAHSDFVVVEQDAELHYVAFQSDRGACEQASRILACPFSAEMFSSPALARLLFARHGGRAPWDTRQYAARSAAWASSSSWASAPASVAGLQQWNSAKAVPHVSVHGFVRSVRAQKRYAFVSLGDGSSLDPLQAVVPANQAEGWDYEADPAIVTRRTANSVQLSLTIGAAVRLSGAWALSPGRGQSHELQVDRVDILGPSDAKVSGSHRSSSAFMRLIPA